MCGSSLKNIVFQSYADPPIFDTFHYIIATDHLLISLLVSSEKFLSIGALSRHCCWKDLILVLTINMVSCFPWSHRFPLFIVKPISAKYIAISTHSLPIIFSGKNGGPWMKGASSAPFTSAHISNNHTTAFP